MRANAIVKARQCDELSGTFRSETIAETTIDAVLQAMLLEYQKRFYVITPPIKKMTRAKIVS